MKADIRRATEADVDVILADIRPADVAEMAALGTTPERAMREGLARSDWTAVGLLDDVPVCMFGVAPVNVMLGRGAPWMLASTALDRMPFEILRREFLPACDRAVDVMRSQYRFLFNVVDQRNRKAVRWLRMLGFNFGKHPLDIGGQTFLVFGMGEHV